MRRPIGTTLREVVLQMGGREPEDSTEESGGHPDTECERIRRELSCLHGQEGERCKGIVRC